MADGNDKRIGLRSFLHYYKELPYLYNASYINFNATSLQMNEAVNQRVFDVPACGAFLLTDHQKSIEALFEIGREVVTYESPDEIREKAAYYLKNPSVRERIAKKGRERVLREHTYRHRIERIVDVMRNKFGG
jgi:spore maturation protein CgeB